MLNFLARLRRSHSARAHAAAPRATARLRLEALEDRTLLSTFFVVPAGSADNVTRFGSLSQALAAPGLGAGGVVQIEPGASPGAIQNSDLPAVAGLTIQGDPTAPLSSIPLFNLTNALVIGGGQAGFTLNHVNVGLVGAGGVVFDTTAAILDSSVTDFNSTAPAAVVFAGGADALLQSTVTNGGGAGAPDLVDVQLAGANQLSGDTFAADAPTGSLLAYRAAASVAVPDQVRDDAFIAAAGTSTGSPLVEVAQVGQASVVFQDDTFSDPNPNVTGIRLEPGTQGTQILGNVISLTGGAAAGVAIFGGIQTETPVVTSAFLQGNQISTNGTGTGLVITTGVSEAGVVDVKVQGNEFYDNQLAVNVLEAGGPTDGIDLGGGSQGSLGDNDLRDNLPAGTFDTSNSLGSNAAFVAILFNDVLKRAGDLSNPNDAGSFLNALNSGALSQAQVAAAIIDSPEGLGVLVGGLYQRILDHGPDPTGEAGFVSFLQNGGTVEQVVADMVLSPEYTARFGADDAFVQSLYTRLLGRTASASELATWVAALPTLGRAGVTSRLLTSVEFRTDVVNELYGFVIAPAPDVASVFPPLLHRPVDPTSTEGGVWVNSPLDILSIYKGFAGSQEAFQGASGILTETALFQTATLVASSKTPSVFGQSVTFTATVTGSGGVPVGAVEFFDGTTDLGPGTALAPSAAQSATSTITISTLSVGGHAITAVYTPSGNFAGSSGSAAQVVDAATATTVASSNDSSDFEGPVTFTATVTNTSGNGGAPTGAVEFFDGATDLGPGSALTATGPNAAKSTFTTTGLLVGDHNIRAVYTPTGDFLGSSGALTQSVNADTSTGVVSNLDPSTFDQNVTFTATVTNTSGNGGPPTGTVEFFDGATDLGTGSALTANGADAATSTFSTATLSAGNHTIRAVYTPAGDFLGSSGALTQTVNAGTSTAVTSNLDPSNFGQNVTFTATVTNTSGNGGPPTGTVEFFDGATDLGAGSALTANGADAATSTFSTANLAAGDHNIRAVYTPTGDFLGSSGSLTQSVDAATSTAVASNLDPSTFGQNVTFTATVTNTSGNGGAPTGTVEFFDGATDLGAGSALTANGADTATSTFSTATLATGNHTIRAVYTPTGDFLGSNGSAAQVVDAATATAVASNLDPSNFGQNVTFTATVTNTSGNGGAPTGTVEFFDGATDLGAGSALTANGADTATSTFSTATLSAGDHNIRAVYTPTGDFLGSSGALTQTVSAGTSTGVVSNLNPSNFGQNVTFTATVTNTSGNGGPPTGSVEFFDGGTFLGLGTALTANGADTATSTFSTATLAAGSHTIRAVYVPTGGFLASNGSLTQTVNAATSTGVASNDNPSTFGNSVTFTATVTNTSGSGGAPTGTVEFFDGGTFLGLGTALTANGADTATSTFSTAGLSVGNHTIQAFYVPSGDFLASNGSVGQAVDAATSTGVTSNDNPATVGDTVTFTATVTNTSGSGGPPTGSVMFTSQGSAPGNTTVVPLGTVLLSASNATQATASVTFTYTIADDYTIVAHYIPTGDFLTNPDVSLMETVNPEVVILH